MERNRVFVATLLILLPSSILALNFSTLYVFGVILSLSAGLFSLGSGATIIDPVLAFLGLALCFLGLNSNGTQLGALAL